MKSFLSPLVYISQQTPLVSFVFIVRNKIFSSSRQAFLALRTLFRFFISFAQFIRFYISYRNNSDFSFFSSDRPTISIIVTSWMYTSVPWFSLALGFSLIKKVNVSFIFDDSNFDSFSMNSIIASPFQNILIKFALTLLGVKYIRMSSVNPVPINSLSIEEVNQIRELAKNSRIHKFKSSLINPLRTLYESRWFSMQIKQYCFVKSLLSSLNFYKVLIPGGVYGNSGLYSLALNSSDKIASFDSGNHRLLFCLNGIAGYQEDVINVVNKISSSLDTDQYNKIAEYVKNEFSLRTSGNDFYKTQICSSSPNRVTGYDIVIPLNITWDLPALGKHRYFDDNVEWLNKTINYILSRTSANICVRQHPHERHHTSGRDLEIYLKNAFGENNRFKFIPSTDHVNSYDLIRNAKLVLPYVSTIGMEAVLMGKTVIMESSCYYSDTSFVHTASSRAHYFKLISQACNGKLQAPSQGSLREAELYYFVSQYCTPLDTVFTPFTNNFSSWLRDHSGEFDNESTYMINSLILNQPAAYLKACNFFYSQ